MKCECSRFKVIEGKSALVDEWLSFLNHHIKETSLTLADEKIYVEAIFRERNDEGEFLYWFTLEDEGGQKVEESTSWIDQKHLEYWYACIDEDYSSMTLESEVLLIHSDVNL